MKVAFATQDCTRIDAHFGWARHMLIYDVQPEGYHYLKTVSFPGALIQDGDGRKLVRKFLAIRGCSLIFVADIGDVAAARLTRKDVQVVSRYRGQPIVTALDELGETLRHRPNVWLRKHLQRDRQRDEI